MKINDGVFPVVLSCCHVRTLHRWHPTHRMHFFLHFKYICNILWKIQQFYERLQVMRPSDFCFCFVLFCVFYFYGKLCILQRLPRRVTPPNHCLNMLCHSTDDTQPTEKHFWHLRSTFHGKILQSDDSLYVMWPGVCFSQPLLFCVVIFMGNCAFHSGFSVSCDPVAPNSCTAELDK